MEHQPLPPSWNSSFSVSVQVVSSPRAFGELDAAEITWSLTGRMKSASVSLPFPSIRTSHASGSHLHPITSTSVEAPRCSWHRCSKRSPSPLVRTSDR